MRTRILKWTCGKYQACLTAAMALLLLASAVSAAPPAEASGTAVQGVPPNVVLILVDDLGWQDVKAYDLDEPSPMETPNLDALADKGVMFWQAYSPAPTCSPTRCAILSGIHPARSQKTHVVGGAPPAPIHARAHPMMPPWYSGRMDADTFTLARALKQKGYVTGHIGKWHIAIDHHAYPQPRDVGFDWTRSDRGATASMRPNRLTGFATNKQGDPYRLDANGFPFHQNSADALQFLRKNADRPFFLYYATWLVHTPIHTRSEQLLDKYCKKLGVQRPANAQEWKGKGQTNPFYCAMVEQLDYYVGKIVRHLEQTDDPRRPGHKLIENTYLIFTSDNGGMEQTPQEIITDNFPLDQGKISLMEGGTRVPLFIVGPGVQKGVQSDVMVNGLDFYPTILSWAGAPRPEQHRLDGADLSKLLTDDPSDPSLVLDRDGQPRDTMVWHFPHGIALESSIRVGDYKLVRNYNHKHVASTVPLELYRLYKTEDGRQVRVDIEESNNLAQAMPELAGKLDKQLSQALEGMGASYPHYNPAFKRADALAKAVPGITAHQRTGRRITLNYKENGAGVARADLIYTANGGERYEEWFRIQARVDDKNKRIEAQLPDQATHYFINLIDENNYLVSYPELPDRGETQHGRNGYANHAIRASDSE